MKIGAKANNLKILRELFPNNVPPFAIISLQDIVKDYPSTIKSIQKLADDILVENISQETIRTRIRDASKTVRLETKKLGTVHERIAENGWQKVSVRTSASTEDGAICSFAGQYVSFVDIPYTKQNLSKYVRSCILSLFSERVLNYAKSHNLDHIEIGGSIVIQEMFYGYKSGVLFTENGKGQMTFAAVDSWRNTAVEGDDATIVNAQRITLQGVGMTKQLRKIAQLSLKLEKYFDTPLDIEWSHTSREVMLLQARPQTTDTSPYSLTWDATNISENYPGITLPLTYSFIKNVYSHVYPSFFRLMGMSERKLKNSSWVFDNALGYIDGRVYYRIDNWYEIVKLIPGKRNQEFFEAMLNPAKKRSTSNLSRTPLSFSFIILSVRFAWLILRSPSYSKKFKKTFSKGLREIEQLNWTAMSAEACLDYLQAHRQDLLKLWGIPILNDVRVMIFHGIFKTILMKDADQKTYLENLKGLDDRASIKPLESLHQIGIEINAALQNELVKDLDDLRKTASWEGIKDSAQRFIDIYGGRTPDELQLENPRLGENIQDVISLAYASKDATLAPQTKTKRNTAYLPIYKRPFAEYVIANMRSAIDYRERFRFNRAQIFGTARLVYLAIGQKMVDAGIISEVDDIFWLTEQEVNSIVRGHSWEYDQKSTIKHRRDTFAAYNKQDLRIRVTGHGLVAPAAPCDSTPEWDESMISGTGVASGRVTAPVIVVRKFDPSIDVTGKILVVKHVDPGWTLLLVQAAGVISEQGNPLSHVAIVSREISIPAVVGIKNAVELFKTGEVISLDGTTGEVNYGA